MTEIYKLLFDLSLYYTISGYYLILIARESPAAALFLALIAAAGLDAFLRSRSGARERSVILRCLPLALPLLALLTKPTLCQALHALPPWLYLGFSMLTDRVDTRYLTFRSRYFLGLRLLLLLIFGPLFPGRFGPALAATVPYLIGMLLSGVCLLRMLREQRREGLRHGLYLAAFALLCAALTLGKAPQMLLKGFGLLYRWVLTPLILVAAIILAGLFYGVYLLAAWLVSRVQGSGEMPSIQLQEAAEILGLENEYAAVTADLTWLKILLIVVASLFALWILFLIFRSLLGDRIPPAAQSPWKVRGGKAASLEPSAVRPGLLRPRDNRLAVRYYYARFLAECRRRGLSVPRGMTATELAERCADVFPGADPAALAAVYRPARYSPAEPVTRADVQRAAELWNALKHSAAPGRDRKRP